MAGGGRDGGARSRDAGVLAAGVAVDPSSRSTGDAAVADRGLGDRGVVDRRERRGSGVSADSILDLWREPPASRPPSRPPPRSVDGRAVAESAVVRACRDLVAVHGRQAREWKRGASLRPDMVESILRSRNDPDALRHRPYLVQRIGLRHNVEVAIRAVMKEAHDEATRDVVALRHAPFLVESAELVFVHDPRTSTLDLIDPRLMARRNRRYRSFRWHRDDFPGNGGPNTGRARRSSRDLSRILPERRANRGAVALLTADDLSRAKPRDRRRIKRAVTKQLVKVPGEWRGKEQHLLHPSASASYVRMRRTARGDGVRLRLLSSAFGRGFEASRERAAARGNRSAVAEFSSHSLGVTIDVALSHAGKRRFPAASTKPYSEVVRSRESSVHKWLFLRAADHGWFPFQHEPWHWEYNPPGFAQRFLPADVRRLY